MLSLCITNYNRYEMLLESFQHVYDDERISEIVISDDCSDWKIYSKLEAYCRDKKKIQLFRNDRNLGMSLNKKKSVELASENWCILFDSDNILKRDYINAFHAFVLDNEGKESPNSSILNDGPIFCPEFAKPDFDYRKFSGLRIDWQNIRQVVADSMGNCLMNSCNYIVNRHKYLEVYRHDPSIKASDTIHFNYLWLKSGGSFYVVPGMQYFHRVHPGSGFLADVNYNMQQAEKTKRMIMQL